MRDEILDALEIATDEDSKQVYLLYHDGDGEVVTVETWDLSITVLTLYDIIEESKAFCLKQLKK